MAATDSLRALYPNIPSHEWDRGACGVGLIANMDGRPTRDLVAEALDALSCLTHRGGNSRVDETDPGTSDGAGIMLDLQHDYFAQAFGLDAPHDDHPFGLAMLFLPRHGDCAARAIVERSLKALGL